ncbi:TetR/AcrR family transcriptional regulator [Sporosarcina sp. PTS2304]|uniref:TetR/AcrR family transcriptional regulator n=1 Tax=Sporosarcina sp. PTS2304 TaxID=2283194 RepID=UPI000E0E0539|nr:TetR/AcrR family transcriptional regulator [Sporosarcina sp. PTS2304]AXI00252.1 TetR/AcrR family transcriptional regulator [Sporosarcina sp. PTS2304]
MQEQHTSTLRKDALQNQQMILEAARALFNEKGVAETTMHQIAKAAGVGQGTLYRRYAHKGELCLDLILKLAKKNHDTIISYLHDHHNEPIGIRLKQTIAYSLDFIEEQCQLLSAIKAPSCDDDVTLIYHSPLYQSTHNIFRDLLEEIPREADATPLNTIYVADLLNAAIAPNLFQFQREDRGYSKDEICDNIYTICIQPLLSQSVE